MVKVSTFAAIGLLTLISAATLISQTPQPEPATAKLQVVVSRFEGDKEVSTQPFQLQFAMGQTGNLKMETDLKKLPASEIPPCVTQAALVNQKVGTQVDSIVTAMPDGKFTVSLTITERNLAGCRTAGNVEVPVFSNRITAHTSRLQSGETAEFVFASNAANKTSAKAAVTLLVNGK